VLHKNSNSPPEARRVVWLHSSSGSLRSRRERRVSGQRFRKANLPPRQPVKDSYFVRILLKLFISLNTTIPDSPFFFPPLRPPLSPLHTRPSSFVSIFPNSKPSSPPPLYSLSLLRLFYPSLTPRRVRSLEPQGKGAQFSFTKERSGGRCVLI